MGLLTGAAIGVAGTLFASGFERGARAPASVTLAQVSDPGRPRVSDDPTTHDPVARGRHARTTKAAETPADAGSTSAAAVSRRPQLDPSTASLDDLVAELLTQCSLAEAGRICESIARRFPNFRYPVDVVHELFAARWSGMEPECRKLAELAVATWPDGFALDEFRRTIRTRDREESMTAEAVARVLDTRGVRLPADLCEALLHDDAAALRARGELLSWYSADVDLARIADLSGHDPEPSVRSAAFRAMSELVAVGRIRPEQVADAIAAGVCDDVDCVESAARAALVAAGPAGAKLALDLIVRDGDIDDLPELTAAVVGGGKAADLLALHLGARFDRLTVRALAEQAVNRPDLSVQLTSRFPEFLATLDAGDDESSKAFFSALERIGQARLIAESAAARNLDVETRCDALDVLLAQESTWPQGHELVRKTAADRGETTQMRMSAIGRLAKVPIDSPRGEAIQGESDTFLRELLQTETNDRVRKYVDGVLGTR